MKIAVTGGPGFIRLRDSHIDESPARDLVFIFLLLSVRIETVELGLVFLAFLEERRDDFQISDHKELPGLAD